MPCKERGGISNPRLVSANPLQYRIIDEHLHFLLAATAKTDRTVRDKNRWKRSREERQIQSKKQLQRQSHTEPRQR